MSPEPFDPDELYTDPPTSLWVHEEQPSPCGYLRVLVGDVIAVARDMWSAWL